MRRRKNKGGVLERRREKTKKNDWGPNIQKNRKKGKQEKKTGKEIYVAI